MKRFVIFLALMLSFLLLLSGCFSAAKKDEAKLFPSAVKGEFTTPDGEKGLTAAVSGGYYINEHFGFKAEYPKTLIVEPSGEEKGEYASQIQEFYIHSTDNILQHDITLHSRSFLRDDLKKAPAEEISRIIVDGMAKQNGEIVTPTHLKQYKFLGETVKGYSADVKHTNSESGQEYEFNITCITLEKDSYLCGILLTSRSLEESQSFLINTFSALK